MPRPRPLWISSCLALAAADVALAQEPDPTAPAATLVEPGSALVSVRPLPEHVATYVLYRGRGAERVPLQEVRRELRRVERDGEELVRLTWHTHAMGREVVDELLLDGGTLAPRARVMPLPTGGVARLTIDGARVTGELTGSDGARTEDVDVTFTARLHDASLPLLAALPLASGSSFRLAALPLELDETPAEPSWVRVTVGERGPFALARELGGIELDAWPIELESAPDGVRTRLWLADEEPFLLQKEVSMPGLGEIVWELKAE